MDAMIPSVCFDPNGDVQCFRCREGEGSVITPARRDYDDVVAAFRSHARAAGHALLLTLTMMGEDGKAHLWQEPVVAAGEAP